MAEAGTPEESGYTQDKNAGNLGDVLKHFWLLHLLDALLAGNRTKGLAYLESHAGAGYFRMLPKHIRALNRNRGKVAVDSAQWLLFDRLNDQIVAGVYKGSFPLVLRRIAESYSHHAPAQVRIALWENHPMALRRIDEHWEELVPKALGLFPADCIRRTSSSPEEFVQAARLMTRDDRKVAWLCDPFWGKDRERDRPWWKLLADLASTFGILFAYVGGNSRKHGRDKFDFEAGIGAPSIPDLIAVENTCAYGLYLTRGAKALLHRAGLL